MSFSDKELTLQLEFEDPLGIRTEDRLDISMAGITQFDQGLGDSTIEVACVR